MPRSPDPIEVRRSLLSLAALTPLLALAGGAAPSTPRPGAPVPTTPDAAQEGSRDFDFLIGHWRVANRRLKARLKGSTEWESFEATNDVSLIPGNIGNFDIFTPIGWRPGLVGMTLRIYNPRTRLWSIYWIDNGAVGVDDNGNLYPPVVGRFVEGIGVFEGDDTLDGRAIRVRYKWYDTRGAQPKWEQSMSADGGKTWEVNFTSVLTRQT